MSNPQLYYQMGMLYLFWASHDTDPIVFHFEFYLIFSFHDCYFQMIISRIIIYLLFQDLKYRKAGQLFEIALLKNRIVKCESLYYVIKPQRPFLQRIS
jgi:hypothetical protein